MPGACSSVLSIALPNINRKTIMETPEESRT